MSNSRRKRNNAENKKSTRKNNDLKKDIGKEGKLREGIIFEKE